MFRIKLYIATRLKYSPALVSDDDEREYPTLEQAEEVAKALQESAVQEADGEKIYVVEENDEADERRHVDAAVGSPTNLT